MRFPLLYWLIAMALLANAVAWYWQSSSMAPAPIKPTNLGDLRLLSELPSTVETEPLDALPALNDVAQSEVPEISGGLSAAEPDSDAGDVPIGFGERVDTAMADVGDSSFDGLEAELPSAAPVTALPRCWWVGPVDDEEISERLLALFASADISMDLVLRTVEINPEHWVYLPTEGNQADIRRLSRTLRQQGIDNFPITDGPLAGSLSLGLFRSEERAEAYRERIAEQGYEASIYLRPAFTEQPWAALTDDGLTALGWPRMSGVAPGLSALELSERDCPGE